jgi:hypothetical protein
MRLLLRLRDDESAPALEEIEWSERERDGFSVRRPEPPGVRPEPRIALRFRFTAPGRMGPDEWSVRTLAQPLQGWLSIDPPSAAAEARAEALLRAWLSPDQLRQYERTGRFEVVGGATGTRYTLAKGRTYNVSSAKDELCFGPVGPLPIGDVLLAQKIALETDERAALRVANRRPSLVALFAAYRAAERGEGQRWETVGA